MKTRKILSLVLVSLVAVSVCQTAKCQEESSRSAGAKALITLARNLAWPTGAAACAGGALLAAGVTVMGLYTLGMPYRDWNGRHHERNEPAQYKVMAAGGATVLGFVTGAIYCGINALDYWGLW